MNPSINELNLCVFDQSPVVIHQPNSPQVLKARPVRPESGHTFSGFRVTAREGSLGIEGKWLVEKRCKRSRVGLAMLVLLKVLLFTCCHIWSYTQAGQQLCCMLCFLSRPTANPFPLESFCQPGQCLLDLKWGDNWTCHTCHAKSIRYRPSHDTNLQQAQTFFLFKY